MQKKKKNVRDFVGGSVAKTLAPNAGGQGSIPSEGTRCHMPQLKPNSNPMQSNKLNVFLKCEFCFVLNTM